MTRNMPVGMHIYVKLKGNKTAKFTVLKRLQGKKMKPCLQHSLLPWSLCQMGFTQVMPRKKTNCETPREMPVKRSPQQPKLQQRVRRVHGLVRTRQICQPNWMGCQGGGADFYRGRWTNRKLNSKSKKIEQTLQTNGRKLEQRRTDLELG